MDVEERLKKRIDTKNECMEKKIAVREDESKHFDAPNIIKLMECE